MYSHVKMESFYLGRRSTSSQHIFYGFEQGIIKCNKIKVLGGQVGWNYKSQSNPASVSQQYGSFQMFEGATAESEGTAVAKMES